MEGDFNAVAFHAMTMRANNEEADQVSVFIKFETFTKRARVTEWKSVGDICPKSLLLAREECLSNSGSKHFTYFSGNFQCTVEYSPVHFHPSIAHTRTKFRRSLELACLFILTLAQDNWGILDAAVDNNDKIILNSVSRIGSYIPCHLSLGEHWGFFLFFFIGESH